MTGARGDESTYGVGIDLDGVRRTWPDGRDLPDIIERFATYLLDKPFESAGYFTMGAMRIDDYWIERGADLWPKFGVFMRFSEGSQLAVWFHDGVIDGAEPVVLIDGEGEPKVVAPNLRAFVTKWASGLGPHELRRPRRQRSHWSADVAVGLRATAESTPDPPKGAPVPDIEAFFDAHREQARAQDASDPTLHDIAILLAGYAPKAPEPWRREDINVAIAGDRVEFLRRRKPIPEREALIPLIHRVREERVSAEHLARGLWHSATIQLFATPEIRVAADWDEEPMFETGGRVTRTQIEADLARFPRGARWRPSWMDELT